MATPAQVLAQYLVDLGVVVRNEGTVPSNYWAVTVGNMPAQGPDNVVTITDTGGVRDGREADSGHTVIHPTVQIRIRSTQYDVGLNLGLAIQALLDKIGVPLDRGGAGFPPVKVGEEDYALKAAHITVPVAKIGREPTNQRELFAVNVMLTVEASTPLNYLYVYPASAPEYVDQLLGYHNGLVVRFTIQDVADLAAGDFPFVGTPDDGDLVRYDGGVEQWVPASFFRETPAGTVDGSNAVFTLTTAPAPLLSLRVYLNGLLQRTGVGGDYSVTGAVLTFVAAPSSGDVVEATYLS